MNSYININARCDLGVDYASIQEVLDSMDRLGIWQTVVEYHGAANSLECANWLIRELDKIPGWRDRIIPCFSLNMAAIFQTGAMDRLTEIIRENQPCCVCLVPKSGQYRLRLAEMLLDRVQEYTSVVLIDFKELKADYGADDLLYLAGHYPNMNFVVRQISRSNYDILADLLYRTKNIFVESSYLYTRGALSLFCRQFGENRILFGINTPANGGGPMAAITFANLSPEAKDNIRGGNFIKLFKKQQHRDFLTARRKAIPNKIPNRFWTPFVEEGRAPDVDIYDIHCHMGPTGSNWYLANADFVSQREAFEQDMETFHLKKIISSVSGRPDLIQANLDMQQAVSGHDRFLGYVRYNPNFGEKYTKEYLDSCFASGYFVGLKTLPSYMLVDIRDELYTPMFRYADEHALPILIHTWQGKYGTPLMCAEAAKRWPNAKVILGHSGGGLVGRLECEKIAQDPDCSNVYFEFCGSFGPRHWSESLKYIDYRRVLYGTDTCLHEVAWEMGRLLATDLSDEELTAILGQNAKQLFAFE